MADNAFQVYPYHADLIQELAKAIVSDNQQQLPFLHNVVVFVPNYQTTFRLQECIAALALAHGHETIIGLQIFTLKDYVHSKSLAQHQNIDPITRELLLLNELRSHQTLFGTHNTLTTTYALLELFDELTRFQIKIPNNYQNFEQQLQKAYRCTQEKIKPLSNEAQIIHTLWQAWHTQLDSLSIIDPETSYQLKLGESCHNIGNNYFYVAGYYDLLPSEIDWLKSIIQQQKASLIFQGENREHQHHPCTVIHQLIDSLEISPVNQTSGTEKTLFFDRIFDNSQANFKTRAEHVKQTLKQSPIKNDLSLFCANSFEEEALAIATQVRAWLAKEKTKIALLIEDRRLARRCRAILEHSGVGLVDLAGWALSTSSTASLVENWLQCIEENFYHIPLVDILKSPFAFNKNNQFNQAIYRFEQDIIQRENVQRDLSRYRSAIKSREHRLNAYHSETTEQVRKMLTFVEESAAPLLSIHNKHTALLEDYLNALTLSLSNLGAMEQFKNDEAGKEIISLIEHLKSASQIIPIKMSWIEFRHWFGLKLEERTFIPENRFEHHVELLHLSQTVLSQYDALIIGNMTHEHYPGTGKSSPFFNQAVRLELGLPALSKQALIRFYHFRRVIESATELLLTYNKGEDDTPASPWLTLISRFHELSFGNNLENKQLRVLTKALQQSRKIAPDSQYVSQTPPRVDKHLVPNKISASSHQQLINCPYAFFAGTILKLRAPEEIKEKLSKSDYGSRVHLCLQAFHIGDVRNIPGPFAETLGIENKASAISLLESISTKVFHNDLEDNFQHRGWLKRWLSLIPSYIDWQMDRSKTWKFYEGEIESEQQIAENLFLKGRVDRVDSNGKEFAVIDYKTGTTPSKVDIEYGEAVQLPHYALSYSKEILQIEYLQFEAGSKPLAEKCTLIGDELTAVIEKTKSRAKDLFMEIESGQELPAWGTEQVCNYCQYAGMCRHYL